MSVIIRLQNLPWSANALDIRNFFRGLSIPEGGVHIVGGELGDAFIAFSTDEDARQAMMLDGGKIKEIQVKLLLSSRSEMHKVIESARQSVPILSLTPTPTPAPAPAPVATPQVPTPPQPIIPTALSITPFSSALGTNPLSSFGIPGLGNPQEIPQPAVIEPPGPLISPREKSPLDDEREEEKLSKKRSKERRRSRSHSRSRDRDRKDRKRDRRDRSRSRERRRRDRSRSRDRRDRKRDRKDRSRSRDRSPRRPRDRRRSPQISQERSLDGSESSHVLPPSNFGNPNGPQMPLNHNNPLQNGPMYNDSSMTDAFNKLHELGKKRNPNAFQGDQQNGNKLPAGRGGSNLSRGGSSTRRDGRPSRFDDQQRDCCVAIRDAPNHTSYGDVRRFFPYMIDKHGIKMINDNMGRRTGNIFVRFCESRSKQHALQRKNNELKGAPVTVEPLDDDMYDAAVDSFLPYREDNDEEDPNLVIAEGEDKNTKIFSALKLVDLPSFIKEHDVMKAFSDFSLLSILISDCRKTRTKVAYVQFVKADEAKQAYDRRYNYSFGRRLATITPMSNEEFAQEKLNHDKNEQALLNENAVNNQTKEAMPPRDPRQRRQPDNAPSLQSGVTIPGPGADQQQFFANSQFNQNFGAPFPRPQFNTFSTINNMEPRAAAGANWGNRMNFPIRPEQLMPAMQQLKGLPVGDAAQVILGDVTADEEPLDCVLMKGLPRETTDRTIVNFLADTGAVPARIHLMLDANSLPSGDCFCEFRSGQEARKAVTKHGKTLDGCRVTVDLVMRSVVEEALEGPKLEAQHQQQLQHQQALLENGPPPFMNGPRGAFRGRGQFRGRGFERGFIRGGFDRGGFNRGGFDQTRGGFDQSRGGFDQTRGGFRGRGWVDRGRGFDRGRGVRGFLRGRGGFDTTQVSSPTPTPDEEQDPALENFGAPGCVVTMENVPFRASIDDIMEFFGDFDLTQDDVIRRYNERGQPTGDARVAFRTPFDAQRAVKTRNLNSIHDRRVNLNII